MTAKVKTDVVEVKREDLQIILEALEAPTHEANEYNCDEWPPGHPCAGCEGDKLRDAASVRLRNILGL